MASLNPVTFIVNDSRAYIVLARPQGQYQARRASAADKQVDMGAHNVSFRGSVKSSAFFSSETVSSKLRLPFKWASICESIKSACVVSVSAYVLNLDVVMLI